MPFDLSCVQVGAIYLRTTRLVVQVPFLAVIEMVKSHS